MTAVLVDTTSTERRNRAVLAEVARVATGAPRAVVNTHHHPDHTYGNGFLPARDVDRSATTSAATRCSRAGLEATKVITAPDYGDLTLRPPEVTFTGPDDAAPRRVPGRAAESAARRTPPTTCSSGCPSRGCCSPATWRSTVVSRSCSRVRSRASAGDRADARPRPGGAAARPRPGLPRRRRGHGCWTTWTATSTYVEHVAAESYAAGLTPLEAAQKHRDNPLHRLGRDRAVRRQPAPRLRRADAGNPSTPGLTIPSRLAGHGHLPRRPDRLTTHERRARAAVVTGHTADGVSVVLSDGPVPVSRDAPRRRRRLPRDLEHRGRPGPDRRGRGDRADRADPRRTPAAARHQDPDQRVPARPPRRRAASSRRCTAPPRSTTASCSRARSP